jgi:hypothetical protein
VLGLFWECAAQPAHGKNGNVVRPALIQWPKRVLLWGAKQGGFIVGMRVGL